jgi:carbon starvation protein
MSLTGIALVVMALLGLGYVFYGGFVARQLRLDDSVPTPAVALNDGVDFVPTRPFYLLGQHFSAIAAAGPIAGPIIAVQMFGWLPCLAWIVFGVIFIGAVHDFTSLVASIRHQGRSIAEIVRIHLGPKAWLAMMIFIWLSLLYVILAFTDVTAVTFVQKSADLDGLNFSFHPGGAVALASVLYLLVAVVMGLVERFLKLPLWLTTVVFVPATLFAVWIGTQFSTVLLLTPATWSILILAYCFVASLTPVWALLQPRGYLGGFVLYIALAAGLMGIFLGGFTVVQPAFKTWNVLGADGSPVATGALFPFLFVTIACSACSGFHGLVCSGTTSKQIEKESHSRPVGYGAMLLEAVVALIALATVMIVSSDSLAGKAPGTIYGEGLGRFVALIIGEQHQVFATTFGAMAFSTFVFDTLDVATRLGRYILQELTGWAGRTGALVATGAMVTIPLALTLLAGSGSWRTFWTLFGTSNQLLAALSLLAVGVWLRKTGRRSAYVWIPMAFVLTITVWSLLIQVKVAFSGALTVPAAVNGGVALGLVILASVLVWEGVKATRSTGAGVAAA